jgi:DUF4097 and DUF4098 domain-containing protein YvlB
MKSAILAFLVLTFGFSLGWASPLATADSTSDDCSAHMQSFNHQYESVVRDEESRNVANQPLNIQSERNGGISISTWDKPEFMVTLCKQVASESDAEGRKILAATKLVIGSGTVSVDSPDHNGEYNLNTLLLIKAPRDAQVTMKTENGGILVRRFIGTADASAENGGISLNQSTGKLTVHAQNGGISIQDCNGDVTADVENGGLAITLPEQWQGKGLEAHTHNGGLMIRVPKPFNSGLEITSSEHVPIVCKADVCENAQRAWDNGHRMFRLGNGAMQIHATTVNGGVVIKDRDRSQETM